MNETTFIDEKQFLKEYDVTKYDRPSVTVDTIVYSVLDIETDNYRKLPEKELKVLLIKRKDHPYKNSWALPGGFVRINESLENAAYRELREETNVDHIYLEQLYTWGDVSRDPRTRVISSSYMALIDGTKSTIKSGTDSDDVRWFSFKAKVIQENKTIHQQGFKLEKIIEICLKNREVQLTSKIRIVNEMMKEQKGITREVLSSEGLAFDHAKILYYSLERLRAKVEFTDVVFNLMSKKFTLTELQSVYEVILDTKLLTANFRRKIDKYVQETDDYTSNAGHRPAKLYQYKVQNNYEFY